MLWIYIENEFETEEALPLLTLMETQRVNFI